MKLKLRMIALALALGAPAFAESKLDAPAGLTLSVDVSEAGTLVWEPINRDDLMGYSIWMRADKGEFTRLNIPTLVGKELKKLPMTTKSSITLKGLGKRELELTVIAEYEAGRSVPSAAVFSKKARRSGPEAAAVTAAEATGAASAESKPQKTPEPEESKSDEGPAPMPGQGRRSVMAPVGAFHSSVDAGVWWEQTVAKGFNTMKELGYTVIDNPSFNYNEAKSWTSTYTRRAVRVPLALEYGLLKGLEIGGDIAFVQERAYSGKFEFGDTTFQDYQSSAAVEANGFGNPAATVRLQPSQSMPLRLSVRAMLPTGGRSRIQAYGEYLFGFSKLAGLDDNAQRIEFKAEFGDRGIEPGLNYSLGLIPAAGESAVSQTGLGFTLRQRVEHGQEVSGQIGYSLPWSPEKLPGSLTAGVGLRSIDPAHWFVNDVETGGRLSNDSKAEFRSFTGINLGREDQMILFLDLAQNVYSKIDRYGALKRAIDSGGRIEFTVKPDGYIFAISGGFYY